MVFTRDFLGLGTTAMIHTNCRQREEDRVEDHTQHASPWIGSVTVNGLPNPSGTSSNAAVAGLNDPIWKIERNTFQQFMALRSSFEEKYMEGSADSQSVHVPNSASRPLASSQISYPKQTGGQLTIFYAGNINVYDDVPVGKAQTIMNLAANGNAIWPTDASGLLRDSTPGHPLSTHAIGNAEHMHFCGQICHNHYNIATDQVSRSSLPTNNHCHHLAECSTPSTPCSDSNPQLMVPRALPQARKASLARFLERRKERMEMMSPYLKRNSSQLGQSATLGGSNNPINPESKFFANFSNPYGVNSIVTGDYA